MLEGSNLAGWAPNFPRKNSKENIKKKTTVSQNKQKEIEMFAGICKRKQRKGKEKLETSNTKLIQVRASSVSI